MANDRDQSASPATLTLVILEKIGVLGILLILWTTIVCFGLVSSDLEVIRYLWVYLFWTWIALAAVGLSSTVLLYLAGRAAERNAPKVEVLEPRVRSE